ncbi:MAG: 1-deoxy-D-xylulose-5-phosphate reductoisomerase [Acidimicrobiia bacterium]
MDGTPGLKPLVILGATGSIGTQALEVASRLGWPVAAIAGRTCSDRLFDLAAAHPAAAIAVADPDEAGRARYLDHLGDRVSFGPDALAALATHPGSIVVNGVVGAAGLAPTIAALEAGNRVALANKESLVVGGPLVVAAAEHGGGEVIPVDSEHSALWQCLVGEPAGAVRRLILTASGGPFRGRTAAAIAGVTVAEALAHPTWTMGPRITIDSATLMNKAFEVIEAHYLYRVAYDDIDVVVHPQSIVHSLVEFADGSVKAQLGEPDMRLPIQYAITYPERVAVPGDGLDLTTTSLAFETPDREAFPCLGLGYRAGKEGGSAPAVLNAADEVAVAAFLDGRIAFPAIAAVVEATLDAVPSRPVTTVADALEVDAKARVEAARLVASHE